MYRHRLTILAAAILACGTGIARIWASESDWDGALIAGAGLVAFGIWLTLSVQDKD